jgi:hypothetical protein
LSGIVVEIGMLLGIITSEAVVVPGIAVRIVSVVLGVIGAILTYANQISRYELCGY